MRALILSTEFPPGPGGIGAHAFNVAAQLHQRGADVQVLSPQDYVSPREAASWSSGLPFPVERLPHLPAAPLQGAWWALRLRRAIRRQGTDILVATGQKAVWLAAAHARRQRLKLVAVGHGTEFGVRRRWQRWLNARSFHAADLVISVSRFTRGFMIENGIEPARDLVIPNGADGDFFRPPMAWELEDLTRHHPFASGPMLVTVGTLSERKGQDLVVQALPTIRERVPEVRYVAIGMDHASGALTALARALDVEDLVHFPGRLPAKEVRTFLGTADLFVLPSRRTAGGDVEGFGIAVVEAALCGTPAVVSRGSGLVEAIQDGETGLAVAPEDPEALAHAIADLLTDGPRRQAMGAKALERSRSEQTWKHRGGQYFDALEELMTGNAAG